MKQLTDKQIEEIASELELGMDCYIHKETCGLISVPNEMDHAEFYDAGLYKDELREIRKNKKSYILIEPLDTGESFKLMRDFTYTLDDEKMRDKLQLSLERPKPFAKFRYALESGSEYTNMWYEFKSKEYIKYVKLMLRFASGETFIEEDDDE
jgi:hypothetical protein